MRRTYAGLAALGALALLLTGVVDTSAQQKEIKVPEGVELVKEVEFGTGGGRPLKLHVLRPKTPKRVPMPVVVWVHGGGWSGGNKEGGIGRLAPLADKGYFCASVEYRLSGEAPFPAQIEDCKCAIRFLRAKAKQFQLDPDRIGVWGSSAGGHLVALLGTSGYVKELEGKGGWQEYSSRVQAVCDFCGPIDLLALGAKGGAKGPIGKLFGAAPLDVKEKAVQANPLTHLTREAPPFLIVHGEKDTTVPMGQSELLRDALKKAGVPVTLHVAAGQGHGLGGPELARLVQEFFDRHLVGDASRK